MAVCVGFGRIEDVEAAMPVYRRAGAARRSPLPDFYIGAHAAARGIPLLTREAARYRTSFPKLALLVT